MELTTAEDVHIVCLFPTLEAAEKFDDEYRSFRILYKNRKDIFGDQLILDEEDNVIGEEEHLLLNASTLSIEEAGLLARKYVRLPRPIRRCGRDSRKLSSWD